MTVNTEWLRTAKLGIMSRLWKKTSLLFIYSINESDNKLPAQQNQ